MTGITYAFKLSRAYIKRFRGLLILGVTVGIAAFFLVKYLFPYLTKEENLRIGIAGRYHTDTLPFFILSELSEGLTAINDDKTVSPSLATSWESPDKGVTWIFHLSEGNIWHDGEEVKSEDINYEFSDVQVEKPDSKTIIFKLQDIFSPFPSVLSKPTFKKGLLGTGDWKVHKLTLSGGFVEELQIINQKKEKKIYKFYPTLERTKLAYKLGQIDVIQETLDATPFNSWRNSELIENVDLNQVVTLFFNTQTPQLGEKNLRQALAYAIDKEILGTRAYSPISPNSWAYNPQVKKYPHDIERSKELIKELPKEIGESLDLKLVSTPALLEVADKIAKEWESVGVKTTVLVSSIIPTEFDAYLTIYDIPQDPDQYSIWHSTQITSTNISKYSSPRIDKLLEEGRTLLNTDERKNNYLDFQRFLLEDLPAVFLYHPTYYTIVRR